MAQPQVSPRQRALAKRMPPSVVVAIGHPGIMSPGMTGTDADGIPASAKLTPLIDQLKKLEAEAEQEGDKATEQKLEAAITALTGQPYKGAM